MHHEIGLPAASNQPEPHERRGASRPAPKRYHYCSYGLQLSSQLKLPELLVTPPCPEPDVEILIGPLSESLDGATFSNTWLQYSEDRCQLCLEGLARYRIEQGRLIQLDRRVLQEPGTGAAAGDLRLHLLGTALGVLLHQRHWLPLHMSALDTPSGVWGFTGHSGAGKSTLAAWLHYRQDWPLVSDDVAVIRPGEALPYLYPGPPRLKLWKDALTTLGIDHHGLIRDLTRTDKYHLVHHRGFQAHAQPLHALVMLERADTGQGVSLEPLKGLDAFKAVMATLYRPEWGQAFNGPARLLHYAAALAEQIQVYRYRRSWSLVDMEQHLEPLVQRINEDAGNET